MELIAAVVIAGPLGYFVHRRGHALLAYLALWAVVFPIQTVVVHSENADDISVLYVVLNALILCLGIGLNRLGSMLRARRTAKLPGREASAA
jgi:hypothetical protein